MYQRTSGLHILFTALVPAVSVAWTAAFGQTAVPCLEHGAADGRPQLHVVASGARRAAGNITFTLYGGNSTLFLKPHGSIALTRVTLNGTSADACFSVAAPGSYAVAVYHDENNNHHFDKNFLGLPAEGYGFSNNPRTLLGPPSLDAASVHVRPGDNHITIQLRY